MRQAVGNPPNPTKRRQTTARNTPDLPDDYGTQPDGVHEVEVVLRGLRLTDPSERIRNLTSAQGNFTQIREGTKTVRWVTDHIILSREEAP